MKRTIVVITASFVLLILFCKMVNAGEFYREYWAEWNEDITNCRGRLRVNDTELSLHKTFGKRSEAKANGLMLVSIDEDLFQLKAAQLYLEMWGGHPGTSNKRFLPNGRQIYNVPEAGAAAGHCTYSYPVIPVKVNHLVTGTNAFQFVCDRGTSFWGHFIIDNAAVRCFLKDDHPDLVRNGLKEFSASVKLSNLGNVLDDIAEISISYPKKLEQSIVSVDYFGRYLGFDDDGDGRENDWHEFTQKKQYRNHIGSTSKPPFTVKWDTTMVPSQPGSMAICALIKMKGGFNYVTDILDNLTFPADRNLVVMYKCTSMPTPFWSRDSKEKKAAIKLPKDISFLKRAQLMIKIWDGGEGKVKEPFKINGHPYSITSRRAVHDVVFTIADVNPEHLRPGKNQITLLSDTEHHGIEVLLPGPVLIARYNEK
ncbi:MAG: hypothetical protein GWN67_16465 [Phycisphaerae bacterium]|nr:hypothetical protein [Phycisphaerae bacterium]NIR63007.1 hypothetical protein [candidate division Zixibacteria bacterium]NIP53803.1 hypothetical protein [Phycisphaerae bacterium]NIS50358.1 hypothetical protein [Phycisphaerae bacterium]NIU10196.1 hypothetical protein [Phycisphaerae bacterium]